MDFNLADASNQGGSRFSALDSAGDCVQEARRQLECAAKLYERNGASRNLLAVDIALEDLTFADRHIVTDHDDGKGVTTPQTQWGYHNV